MSDDPVKDDVPLSSLAILTDEVIERRVAELEDKLQATIELLRLHELIIGHLLEFLKQNVQKGRLVD